MIIPVVTFVHINDYHIRLPFKIAEIEGVLLSHVIIITVWHRLSWWVQTPSTDDRRPRRRKELGRG